MFHDTGTVGPAVPSFFWLVYSTVTWPKFNETFSVTRSWPPEPPVEIDETMRSFMETLRYSTGVPPALRTVSFASLKCLPLQQNLIKFGDDESTYFVNDRSC